MSNRPIYDSTALQVAADTNYTATGDNQDGTPVKIVPSLGLIRQFARAHTQQPAQYINWILNQLAQVELGLIADINALEASRVDTGEQVRAMAAENNLQAEINALQLGLNNEIARAKAAEANIPSGGGGGIDNSALLAEIARAKAAENRLYASWQCIDIIQANNTSPSGLDIWAPGGQVTINPGWPSPRVDVAVGDIIEYSWVHYLYVGTYPTGGAGLTDLPNISGTLGFSIAGSTWAALPSAVFLWNGPPWTSGQSGGQNGWWLPTSVFEGQFVAARAGQLSISCLYTRTGPGGSLCESYPPFAKYKVWRKLTPLP